MEQILKEKDYESRLGKCFTSSFGSLTISANNDNDENRKHFNLLICNKLSPMGHDSLN